MDKERFYKKCDIFLQELIIPTWNDYLLLLDLARMEEYANKTNYKGGKWHGFTIFNRKKRYCPLDQKVLEGIAKNILLGNVTNVALPYNDPNFFVPIDKVFKVRKSLDLFFNRLNRRYSEKC